MTDLVEVPGTSETRLPEAVVQELPAGAPPPAPWTVRATAIMWLSRARPGVTRTCADGVRGRPLLTLGAVLRYLDTPVGSYREVMAGTFLVHGRRLCHHVPFLAVDSPASLVAGRLNWALPKAMARFDGEPTEGAMRGSGADWDIAVTARVFGPPLPVRFKMMVLQQHPDGALRRNTVRISGRGRLARVQVEASGGPQFRVLLPSGRFLGIVLERVEGWLSVPA